MVTTKLNFQSIFHLNSKVFMKINTYIPTAVIIKIIPFLIKPSNKRYLLIKTVKHIRFTIFLLLLFSSSVRTYALLCQINSVHQSFEVRFHYFDKQCFSVLSLYAYFSLILKLETSSYYCEHFNKTLYENVVETHDLKILMCCHHISHGKIPRLRFWRYQSWVLSNEGSFSKYLYTGNFSGSHHVILFSASLLSALFSQRWVESWIYWHIVAFLVTRYNRIHTQSDKNVYKM